MWDSRTSFESSEFQPVFVVVDMQEHFDYRQNTIAEVRRQLFQAVTKECPVLFVEYQGFGRTDERLLALTKDYPHLEVVQKSGKNGAEEIIAACRCRQFDLSHIWICGVYVDQCLSETVSGLATSLPESAITVLADASEGSSAHSQPWSWLMFPRRLLNVRIRQSAPQSPPFSLAQRTRLSGGFNLHIFEEKREHQRLLAKLSDIKAIMVQQSELEQRYLQRLLLWAETAMLRAVQFLEQASVLAGEVSYRDSSERFSVSMAELPDFCIAAPTEDRTDLLQLALDEVDHARLAHARCREYIITAGQVLTTQEEEENPSE